MKAVRLTQPNSPLQLQEVLKPEPGPLDVLVRVKAAGICHSDAHYRSGVSSTGPLPLTLGHEVAGVAEAVGDNVMKIQPGDRVCIHYMVTCGHCLYCDQGSEQFCTTGKMVGKHRDGGYAEFICVPERSVFRLPDEIPFPEAAVLMCSSATSLHAISKARLTPGESIAVFGIGGLGISAIQLAKAFGATAIFAVDINPRKLKLAEKFGAIPVNAAKENAVDEIKSITGGRGVDVSLELIGLPSTMRQAVQCLGIFGRAALVGLTNKTMEVAPYTEVLNKEAEIIGVSDHLANELPLLLEWTRQKKLDLSHGIIRTIPLDAHAINEVLGSLENFSDDVRVVIEPR